MTQFTDSPPPDSSQHCDRQGWHTESTCHGTCRCAMKSMSRTARATDVLWIFLKKKFPKKTEKTKNVKCGNQTPYVVYTSREGHKGGATVAKGLPYTSCRNESSISLDKYAHGRHSRRCGDKQNMSVLWLEVLLQTKLFPTAPGGGWWRKKPCAVVHAIFGSHWSWRGHSVNISSRWQCQIHFVFDGEKRGQGKQSWTRPEDTEGVGGTEHGWSYKLRDNQELKLNMLGTHSVIALSKPGTQTLFFPGRPSPSCVTRGCANAVALTRGEDWLSDSVGALSYVYSHVCAKASWMDDNLVR